MYVGPLHIPLLAPDIQYSDLGKIYTGPYTDTIYRIFFYLKVIRHVFGSWIEFLENKDIGIFGHFMVIEFITRYSSHTYFSPFSTS